MTTKPHTKKTKRKSSTRRGNEKYPALNPGVNLRMRAELIDYDYVDKLSEKEKKWLNDFTEEEVIAAVDKDPKKNRFNRTRKKVKECYDRNNARNRDVVTRQKAGKKLKYLEEITSKGYSEEDRIHARIELQKIGVLDENGYLKRKKRGSKLPQD